MSINIPSTTSKSPPVVLSMAGSDPSAGAGLQADLLTLASLGVHGCTAVTALTVQNSVNVQSFTTVSAEHCLDQARAILEDIPVQVIKIGMLGSVAMVRAVAKLIAEYPEMPVVLDPVLAAGGGTSLAGKGLRDAMVEWLLPKVTIVTPNGPEALILSEMAELSAAGIWLNHQGSSWVLITGGHGEGQMLENLLFHEGRVQDRLLQTRLPHTYHGSGCTLASAIAAGLAQGQPMREAVSAALDFTHGCLQHAYCLGHGQYFPNRFYQHQNFGNHR
ncbi:MAG: bifunctional hydroxymethylpyrimidine kinase/phosphomethylpyrimidine kinase [Acidithiobacillus sp.]